MNQNMQTIRTLRDNFLKRHQLDPDFFTMPTHNNLEDEPFQDREIMHPKRPPLSARFAKSNQISRPLRPSEPDLRVYFKPKRQEAAPKSSTLLSISPKKAKKEQNDKKDQVKQIGSRRSQALMPKYAQFLTRPCSVSPIKMSPRPESSLTKERRRVEEKRKQFKLAEAKTIQRVNNKAARKSSWFLPWETDISQYGHHL